MSINRWMDKESVVHIDIGILLSHKKELIWICSNEVDETREYYTEWSKSEREIWISYSDTYIWNLKRWHWWIYFQGSSGETDIENRPTDMGGGSNVEMYRPVCETDRMGTCCTTPEAQAAGWGGRRWEGVREGGDMGVPVADSCWCLTEHHRVL